GVIAAAAVITACSGSATSSVQWMPATATSGIPTVAQVAAEMHGTGGVTCPRPGGAVGVTAGGNPYLGTERIGINVFPDNALRDTWKSGVAASFGAVIVAQGTDWLAY